MLNAKSQQLPPPATVEAVIQTLQTELPTLFYKDISYDIYDPNISFQDPVNRFKGKFSYRVIFWTLRFHARLFFTQIHFDLHQVKQDNDNTICAEWTVRGTLRLPWKPQIFFNGYSMYHLNGQGLVDEHIDTWDRPASEVLRQFFRKSPNDENDLISYSLQSLRLDLRYSDH